MNKKISVGVCISLVAIACAITYVLTMTVSLNTYNQKIAGVDERESFYTKYQEIDSFVRNNYIGSIDETRLIVSMFGGYMKGIDPKYAQYHTANEYYELQQQNSGSLVSTGMIVEPEGSGYIRISGVYEGSSAAQMGVVEGDIITAIDGKSVLELGVDKAMRELSGEEGTRVSVTLQRAGEETRQTLIRQSINIITVKGVAYNNIGYIKITDFNDLSDDQFIRIIDEMESSEVDGIIIDVRGLGGSIIAPVRNMLNRLIGEEVVATAEDKNGNITSIITTDDMQSCDLPIVVMVNEKTSNFSELFASVLRDYKNAQIVGVTTAGDATMLKTQALRDGSAVTISVAKVKSAASAGFDGVGIKPDFVLEMTAPMETNILNIENTADTQLRKAIEVLETLE